MVFGIGMELPAGGPPQAKVPAGIAAELRSLVKRKKPTRVLGFILHCTGFIWACGLKSKSDAVNGLKEFLSWLPRQQLEALAVIHNISCLQSD